MCRRGSRISERGGGGVRLSILHRRQKRYSVSELLKAPIGEGVSEEAPSPHDLGVWGILNFWV